MAKVKRESKYWGFYDRFGVTIGLIVDLAAIISFLFSVRLKSSTINSNELSDTALGIMAVALVYSLGFMNYQVYKRWEKVKKVEQEVIRRFVLALITNFPFTALYMHLITNNHAETLSPFGASGVLTLLSQVTLLPLVLLIAYGFELISSGKSNFSI